jgi:uncharacterized protein YbjQ (UPF0145 family)
MQALGANMKRLMTSSMAALAVVAGSDAAFARNDRAVFPISGAMARSVGAPVDRKEAQFRRMAGQPVRSRLDGGVAINFGGGGGQALGGVRANVRLSVGGAPQDACNRAFKEALIQLQSKAKALGGNGVGNITSQHLGSKMSGGSEYLCGVGSVQTNVILEGVAYR